MKRKEWGRHSVIIEDLKVLVCWSILFFWHHGLGRGYRTTPEWSSSLHVQVTSGEGHFLLFFPAGEAYKRTYTWEYSSNCCLVLIKREEDTLVWAIWLKIKVKEPKTHVWPVAHKSKGSPHDCLPLFTAEHTGICFWGSYILTVKNTSVSATVASAE